MMPPPPVPQFRVAARHSDKGHANHTWFQVGPTHYSKEAADRYLPSVQERFAEKDGYEHRIEELVESQAKDADLRWKDVS